LKEHEAKQREKNISLLNILTKIQENKRKNITYAEAVVTAPSSKTANCQVEMKGGRTDASAGGGSREQLKRKNTKPTSVKGQNKDKSDKCKKVSSKTLLKNKNSKNPNATDENEDGVSPRSTEDSRTNANDGRRDDTPTTNNNEGVTDAISEKNTVTVTIHDTPTNDNNEADAEAVSPRSTEDSRTKANDGRRDDTPTTNNNEGVSDAIGEKNTVTIHDTPTTDNNEADADAEADEVDAEVDAEVVEVETEISPEASNLPSSENEEVKTVDTPEVTDMCQASDTHHTSGKTTKKPESDWAKDATPRDDHSDTPTTSNSIVSSSSIVDSDTPTCVSATDSDTPTASPRTPDKTKKKERSRRNSWRQTDEERYQ
jgi:hypothetical protein